MKADAKQRQAELAAVQSELQSLKETLSTGDNAAAIEAAVQARVAEAVPAAAPAPPTDEQVAEAAKDKIAAVEAQFAAQRDEAVANAIAGVADQALQLADQPPFPARVMFGMPLRRVALAEQHRRTVLLQQAVQQRRVVLLGQVHQPQVGRALQRGVVDPGRVGVEHHLVTMAEQRLLQHVALQRGVGDHRDPWRGALTHAGRPGTGWLRAARFPGKACRGTG